MISDGCRAGSAKKAFLSVCLLVVSACASTGKTIEMAGAPGHRLWDYKKSHFNMYSWADEVKIGEAVQKRQIESFEKKHLAVDPPAKDSLKKRVEAIVSRLAKVSDMPEFPYEAHIYDKPDVVNAFCMPGGKIGVFTGIFAHEKGLINESSDDEIAAVLSHEIAHATLRHVTRQMTTAGGLNILGGLISIGVGTGAGGHWQSVFNQVFSTGAQLYLPNYTRAHEAEADQVGLYYMTKAGFDPAAAVRIWERAAKRGEHAKTSFFSTHPGSLDRAAYLRKYLVDAREVREQMKMVEAAKREK